MADARRSSVSLIRRLRAGEPGALDRLVTRYLAPLRRWARGRLPRAARAGVDTDDVVQDALVGSMRNLGSFEPTRQGALETYLRKAVINQIRDQVRRRQRRPTDLLDSDVIDACSPSPHDQAVAADLRLRYEHALERLDPDERALVVARVNLQYTYQQIAVAFGKPTPDAARMAVTRALDKIALIVKRRH